MTYEQATELVDKYPRENVEALAEENRLEAIRPASRAGEANSVLRRPDLEAAAQ